MPPKKSLLVRMLLLVLLPRTQHLGRGQSKAGADAELLHLGHKTRKVVLDKHRTAMVEDANSVVEYEFRMGSRQAKSRTETQDQMT
ncbi:hypothetical protein R1flu_016351 [Riccia fluitans]|uniref:Uncharacterized protein n=1 Tax=Riccia fluitans TaxID=41844 RepID=A0ABD1YLZ0_9MARC